jgi:diguanylate cyclase (GGDEF)-like protein
VGVLAQSFRHTADHLKSYISNINTLASTDSMTGTKNRTAYLARITEIDLQLAKGMLSRFAVVMFDLNNLKYINDTFGHSEGDKCIIATAKRLRQYFPSAELFRFGGDEFVALLLNVPPTEIDDMIAAFEGSLLRRNKRQNVKLSIACGYAFYHESFDSCFADVYTRADAAMYSQKRKFKSDGAAR